MSLLLTLNRFHTLHWRCSVFVRYCQVYRKTLTANILCCNWFKWTFLDGSASAGQYLFKSDNSLNSITAVIMALNRWDKVFKNGPSKNSWRQPLKNLKKYGPLKQTISPQLFQRLSSTIVTWSIIEYFHSVCPLKSHV